VYGAGLLLRSGGHELDVVIVLELAHQLSFAQLRLRHLHPRFLFSEYGLLGGEAGAPPLDSVQLILAKINLLLLFQEDFLLFFDLVVEVLLGHYLLLHGFGRSLRMAELGLLCEDSVVLQKLLQLLFSQCVLLLQFLVIFINFNTGGKNLLLLEVCFTFSELFLTVHICLETDRLHSWSETALLVLHDVQNLRRLAGQIILGVLSHLD